MSETVYNTTPETAVVSNTQGLGDTKENRDNVNKTAFLYAIAALVYTGAQLLCSFLLSKRPDDGLMADLSILMILVTDLLIMVPVFMLLTKKVPTVELKKSKLGAGKFITAICICFFFMLVGAFAGSQLNSLITGNNSNLLVDSLGGGNLLIRFLGVGVAAPICEELIFRKHLIDRFARFGNAFAVLTSALMFGLFHMNLQQFFYAFLLGAVFGYIYVKTGNVKYTIALHMIINSYSSVLLMGLMDGMETSEVKTALFGLAVAIEVIVGFVGAILYIINLKKIKVEEIAENPGKSSFAVQGWGMWVFYILMIAMTVVVTIKVFM